MSADFVSRLVGMVVFGVLGAQAGADLAASLETSQQFFALYLASHGLVKLAVVAALWRGYLWAYPLALAVMALFILYQLYRLSLEMSWPLVGLTLFDLIVVALIWTEYRAREATIAKGA